MQDDKQIPRERDTERERERAGKKGRVWKLWIKHLIEPSRKQKYL